MDYRDRLAAYSAQHQAAGRSADMGEVVADDYPWLTPAQRRRLNHKDGSPKSHSHSGLLVVSGEGDLALVQRLPCPRCCTPARRQPRVGGIA